MSSRTYAQIECSLKSSKKLRALTSHKARWAYLCVHLSDYCTYTGLFRYPSHVWAHDAQIDPSELEAAITEMKAAGLIDHDPEEHFVRLVGWFHKRSGPDNPNRVDGIIADLASLEDIPTDMLCKSVAELAVASVKRSLRWKEDAPGRQQLYASLKRFLAEVNQDLSGALIEVMQAELSGSPTTVSVELKAIFPPLALTPNNATAKASERVGVTLREHETRRDVDETKTKRNLDVNETGEVLSSEMPQASQQASVSELPRKKEGPTLATIQSAVSRAARGAS